MKAMTLLLVPAVCGALLWGRPVTAAPPESPEQLLKRMERIAASWKKARSSRMTIIQTASSQLGESRSTTKVWTVRRGASQWTRSETDQTSTTPGSNRTLRTKTLQVSDGKVTWVEVRENGKLNQVVKTSAQPADQSVVPMMDLIQSGETTVKPTEVFDGQLCSVVEVRIEDQVEPVTVTLWFSERYGIPIQVITEGSAVGKSTFQIKDMQTDIKVDRRQFAYTPPRGVAITDMTTDAADALPADEKPPPLFSKPRKPR